MSGLEFDFTLSTTNGLASYDFMDAGRNQETSGSEAKDFITHSTASSMSIMLVSIGSPCLPSLMWGPQADACTGHELCYTRGILSLGNLTFYSKQ